MTKKNEYQQLIIFFLLAIMIALSVIMAFSLHKQITKKNEMIKLVNQTYVRALCDAKVNLYADYKTKSDSEKLNFYTELTTNLQAAATVFPHTEYATSYQTFGYTLECLNQYLKEQFELSGLDLIGERQKKLYNYLFDIAQNPNDANLMNELDDYIGSFDKPIPPDSLTYK